MIILNLLLLPSSDTRSLTELITAILQRVGDDIDRNHLPQILVSFVIQIAYNVLFFFFFQICLERISKSYLMSCFACLFAIIYCSMKMKTATKSYLHLTVTLQQQWTMPGLLVGRYDHFFHGLSCEELTLACANHMLCPCIVHVRPMIV